MLDMENSGGYARGSPEAGARFTFADRGGSALTNDSLDAAAQIAEVMSVYSVLHSNCRHMPAFFPKTHSMPNLSQEYQQRCPILQASCVRCDTVTPDVALNLSAIHVHVQARVVSAATKEEGGSEYTLYRVEVTPTDGGDAWSVQHRFKDFMALRAALTALMGSGNLPGCWNDVSKARSVTGRHR